MSTSVVGTPVWHEKLLSMLHGFTSSDTSSLTVDAGRKSKKICSTLNRACKPLASGCGDITVKGAMAGESV